MMEKDVLGNFVLKSEPEQVKEYALFVTSILTQAQLRALAKKFDRIWVFNSNPDKDVEPKKPKKQKPEPEPEKEPSVPEETELEFQSSFPPSEQEPQDVIEPAEPDEVAEPNDADKEVEKILGEIQSS